MSNYMPQTARLAQKILDIVPGEGMHLTPIPGVGLYRADSKTQCVPTLYEPCLVIVLQGAKRGYFNGKPFDYNPSTFLTFTLPIPVESEIVEASPDRPFVGMGVKLEPAEISDILLQIDEDSLHPMNEDSVISASPLTGQMLDALDRLFASFDSPSDARVLGNMARRELIYRTILSPQGGTLRAGFNRHSHFRQIGDLMRDILQDPARPLTTEEMCQQVGMSKSSLHESFKSVTAMSPLQYVKSIRLHQARAHMLNDGLPASTAGFQVGYASPSQFSREFKRMFGVPPSRVAELG